MIDEGTLESVNFHWHLKHWKFRCVVTTCLEKTENIHDLTQYITYIQYIKCIKHTNM